LPIIGPHRTWQLTTGAGTLSTPAELYDLREKGERRGTTMIADAHNRRRPSANAGLSLKRKPPMRTVYSAAPSAILRAASERCSVRSRSLRTMHPQFWRWAPWCISARAKPRGEGLCFPWCQCWTTQIIDAAGDFLIQSREYADGLVLYRAALQRFPDVAVFHQGRGCCAGHMGELQEAVAASRYALELEPDNQQFVNDLAWSLIESGSLQEASTTL